MFRRSLSEFLLQPVQVYRIRQTVEDLFVENSYFAMNLPLECLQIKDVILSHLDTCILRIKSVKI